MKYLNALNLLIYFQTKQLADDKLDKGEYQQENNELKNKKWH